MLPSLKGRKGTRFLIFPVRFTIAMLIWADGR